MFKEFALSFLLKCLEGLGKKESFCVCFKLQRTFRVLDVFRFFRFVSVWHLGSGHSQGRAW